MLQKIEWLFNGKLGNLKTYPLHLWLKYNVKPICTRPFPVSKVHEDIFKNEVELLVLLGFLENPNHFDWGSQSFAKPKT